jgi:hypothetical protein
VEEDAYPKNRTGAKETADSVTNFSNTERQRLMRSYVATGFQQQKQSAFNERLCCSRVSVAETVSV